jgi:hypothetical protein
MVIRTILECDRCAIRCDLDSFCVEIERTKDASGTTEGKVESVDLCYTCCHTYLRELTKKMSHEASREFVKWSRDKPKPIRV